MFSKTSSAAMAATAFTLSLALVSPAVGATTTTPTANATVAAAQPAKGGDARTLFGTTAPREGGQSLAQAIARQDNAYGRVPALRLFYTGLPASWEHIRSQTGKRRVVVSFKADPVAVANGRFDSELRRWFATAPTDARTWWSFWHEPEDNIEGGNFTAAQYRSAWKHVADLADAAHNDQLRATLILMCWTLEKGSHRDWHDYYAAQAIQVLGWDCYNAAWQAGSYRTPENLFAQVLEIADKTGLPYGLGEFGSVLAKGDGNGADRAAWLDRSAAYLSRHGAKFVTYFDSNIGVEFRLSDRNSRLAWKRAVSSS